MRDNETVWVMCAAVLMLRRDVYGDGTVIDSESFVCEKLLDHPGLHVTARGLYVWADETDGR